MKIYPFIEGLTEFKAPKECSDECQKLNASIDRRYNIDNVGNITIEKEVFEKEDHIFNMENGKLIGTNEGEWGGYLMFKNNKIEYIIINDNICGIINYKNDLYVLTGLAHLGGNDGNIVKIKNTSNKWIIENVMNLGSCPRIFSIFEDLIYIITDDGVIIFDGIKTNKILSDQFWQGLYPKTMFINNEIIAIGLRGCIVSILARFDQQFL